jgi:hypothetical protein
MAKKSALTFDAGFFLQLCLGLFFLMLGIMGLGDYDTSVSKFARWLGRDDTLKVIMSVVEIVMGAILLLGLFLSVSSDLTKLFSIALFVLWAVYMAITFFLNDSFMKPSAVVWFYNISWNAVILVALWIVGRRLS